MDISDMIWKHYIKLSCISHLASNLSPPPGIVKVGTLFKSCRSMFRCLLGYSSLTEWLMKCVSVFWLGFLEGS